MISHLEESFYRNKRVAIGSSALLIATTAFSLRIDDNATLLGLFSPDAVPGSAVTVAFLLICAYLNASYFLHYYTEVPEWRRNPDTGLIQVEKVDQALRALAGEISHERSRLEEMENKALSAIELHANKLSTLFPPSLGAGFEDDLYRRISQRHGAIYLAAFNQLSNAIRTAQERSPSTKIALHWGELAEKVTQSAAEQVSETAKEQMAEMLDNSAFRDFRRRRQCGGVRQ